MDKATTEELLAFILESIVLIQNRFAHITCSDDFMKDEAGLTQLDAIVMRVQAIGEALKNLDKRERKFLLEVADARYWSEIIKARDFISHHYMDLNAEIIFDLCTNELGELEDKIIRLKKLLQH